MLRTFFRYIRKSKYHYASLVEVRIFGDRIRSNYEAFQRMLPSGVRVAPVLKSNAYGHGLLQVARCLRESNVPFLAVDSYYEALTLRNEGVQAPLVIIGYTAQENIYQKNLLDVAFTLISKEEIAEISKKLSFSRRIHIKIDTGMHRQGILPEDCNEVIALVRKNKNILLQGISTHFADADTVNSAYTQQQITTWNTIVAQWRNAFPYIQFFHAAATCGIFFSQAIDANVMRLGIGLYGIAPCNHAHKLVLQPALEMRSAISSVKYIQPGESVGYNCTYTTTNAIRIATVPVGYFEGIDRRLSSKGWVQVRGVLCPIIGRVSMNIISVDVSEVQNVRIGDSVTVMSAEPQEKNSIESIARICETIPYEILVHIPAQLRRKIVWRRGKAVNLRFPLLY